MSHPPLTPAQAACLAKAAPVMLKALEKATQVINDLLANEGSNILYEVGDELDALDLTICQAIDEARGIDPEAEIADCKNHPVHINA